MAKRRHQRGRARYERVVKILNEAQGRSAPGHSVPDYQGYGRFWQDYDLLMSVSLYGRRMIAPAKGGNVGSDESDGGHGGHCCGSSSDEDGGADAGSEQDSAPSHCWPTGGQGSSSWSPGGGTRSARSWLIKGLRGEYPFSGSIFEPLLWNARHPVADADINFIAAWIDDGCPRSHEDESKKAAVQVIADERLDLATGNRLHKPSERPVNEDCKKLKCLPKRKEISCLSHEELTRYRAAIKCMMTFNEHWLDERSFNFWARIHTNSCQHGWEEFLPWHRFYVYYFEQMLQDYDEHITVPYWSWADYADANQATTRTLIADQGIIPEAFRCWIDEEGIENLDRLRTPKGRRAFTTKQITNMRRMDGHKYDSGLRFLKVAQVNYGLDPDSDVARWNQQIRAVYAELERVNVLWVPNRWPGALGQLMHYPTKADVEQLLNVRTWAEFGSGPASDHHFGAIESMHNGMHNFSGGMNPHFVENGDTQSEENPKNGWMVDPRITAYDPIFWSHHSNVDRLWWLWQERHPGANPEDLDAILPPWALTARDSLSIKSLGYEYVRDTYHYPVHSDTPVTRMHTEMSGVRPGVLDLHARAEIRLHRVQRGNLPNASFRIFLNEPTANADTDITNNEHYVGQVTTFHSSCYGGPGHCDLPAQRTRRFDRRKLHHNEPRNFRINATEAVRRMLASGASDLSVHVVVVGLDGRPQDGALFFDGVSLTFYDDYEEPQSSQGASGGGG